MSRKKQKKRVKKLARPPKKGNTLAPDFLQGVEKERAGIRSPRDEKVSAIPNIENIADFQREKERMMRAISHAIETKDFATPEDEEAFLDGLTGKNFSDILEELPESPDNEVLEKLDAVYNAPPEKAEKLAGLIVRQYPESLDAHLAHARHAMSPAAAVKGYQKTIALGRKQLGNVLEETPGFLAGHHKARPWLNAMFELAEIREIQGREDAAISLFREILRLNSNDNQGARFALLRLLLEAGRDTEARELYLDYEDDMNCLWLYARALLQFRRIRESHPWQMTEDEFIFSEENGELPEIPEPYFRADPFLERALDANPYMARFILFPHFAPEEEPDLYSPGGEEEALCYFRDLISVWHSDPAAFFWLFVTTTIWAKDNDFADLLDEIPLPPEEFF